MDAQSVSEKLRSSGLLRTQGLIGGKWLDSYDNKTIKVNNPATGEIIADVACMGTKETNDAIASSYEAFTCMLLFFITLASFFSSFLILP
jgi:succinate-semialdehyde dehydrogenase